MNHKTLLGSAVALALVGASLFTATPASAAGPSDELVYSVTAPMYIRGYDKAIAEAHGFTIVTDPDGTQRSVPVTKQAKAQAAAAALKTGVTPNITVGGDCGSSSLFIYPHGLQSISVRTGYAVVMPTVGHQWDVDGFVTSGTWSSGFSGLNWSSTWSATHFLTVGNSSHGWGQVRSGSKAFLINGGYCWSGQPYDSW